MTRDTLRRGDQGPDVVALQEQLARAGYPEVGKADGDFGKDTQAAVLAFQVDRPQIPDTGIADPVTRQALLLVSSEHDPVPPRHPVELIAATDQVWADFDAFIDVIVGRSSGVPVAYGPGRAIWEHDRFVITYSPGHRSLPGDLKYWPNVRNAFYASLHCTSFTNLFLSWLYRRNAQFTPGGNMPELFDLVRRDSGIHLIPGGGQYRGFGEVCTKITPDGSGTKRQKQRIPVMDMREMFERRASMPSFVVWAMSTRYPNGQVLSWHHTGICIFRNGQMFRCAADGYKDKATGKYSAAPMKITEITAKNVDQYANYFFHVYGLDTFDGTYGDQSRPVAKVVFE